MVVDRLDKFGYFVLFTHCFMAKQVAKKFVEHVAIIHDMPQSILSDRDLVFLSGFWSEFFKLQGMTFKMSMIDHM